MPAADYVAGARLDATESKIFLARCSDPRFRPATAEFVHASFPAQAVDEVVLPGSVWWLAKVTQVPSGIAGLVAELKQLRNGIKVLIQAHHPTHLVLVGHQDCLWYKRLYPHLTAEQAIRQQGEDIIAAKRGLLSWLESRLEVSGYIATFDREGVVTFRNVV
jgi:hypothetical protein